MATKFEDLTIQNNFLFQQVMKNQRICKRLIEELLNIKIAKLSYPLAEQTIETGVDSRGIRLDIIVADENHTHYNLEMQVENRKSQDTGEPLLPKRTRYYQSSLDMDLLSKGQNFDKLNATYIIFICAFDLFGEGRYTYTFKSKCQESPGLELANGATVMIINSLGTKGNISPRAKSFLEYVNDRIVRDAFTQEIADEVTRVKRNSEVRRQYMLLEMRLHDERMAGRAEGRAEGREEGMLAGREEKAREIALEMLKDKYALAQIFKLSSLSKEEIYALAQANGLEVVE
ncbi:MAG: Rpn family recombination-promoting nuclease/putative transposase [Phascolarctobacterium sp.]|uniref:Rpn family recombination-promoting nuclease/putative transposase n=1 Tax=Phascolarctobacterium sp. TaxID=2049039 RepID=UPI0026DDA371|nr:Rpn family recombination-promoting nuclease/putative transposase [Phascolarctobacterium sp.]MDO4921619.1 Rpn family recombination-promoting nuclease/putative transposase [Phascolarctobacterium sp.]